MTSPTPPDVRSVEGQEPPMASPSRTKLGLLPSLRDALFRPKSFFGSDQLDQAPFPALIFAAAVTCAFISMALFEGMPGGEEIVGSFWTLFVFPVSLVAAYIVAGVLYAATRLGFKGQWTYRRALVVSGYTQLPLFLSPILYLGQVAGWLTLIWYVVGVRFAYTTWLRALLLVLGLYLGASVGVALVLRTLVIEAFKVPSGAMHPTVELGDHLFVNKWPWALGQDTLPDRGDVMVFQYPYGEETVHYIKRVVALPGEIVEIRQGDLLINDEIVQRCEVGEFEDDATEERRRVFVEFLGESPHLIEKLVDNDAEHWGSRRDWGPFTVPSGEVFVMGDSRDSSSDSTRWREGLGGGVPLNLLKGRVMMIWFPSPRFSSFPGTSAGELTLGLPTLEPAVQKCLTAQ